ncbi:MAG: hypothetical protein QXO44_00815 [Thermoplasmatales archaeon]
MDPNFWFSPGGQALLSVLGSLRIGPRKEVAKGGIRPFAPLETYMRFRGAEQLLSQLPAEYQPFARIAVYSGVPIDLARIFEAGQKERKLEQYAGDISRSLEVSPELARLVVAGIISPQEAREIKLRAELPTVYPELRTAVGKLQKGEELSGREVQLLQDFSIYLPVLQKQITTQWLMREAHNVLLQLDPKHPTAIAIREAMNSGNTDKLQRILQEEYPVSASRLKALDDINAAVKEIVKTGSSDKLGESLIKYTLWGILTTSDVNIVSNAVDLIHNPTLAKNLASLFREELLPYIRNPELKNSAKAIISAYELGYYDFNRFLTALNQIVGIDARMEERKARQEETKTSPIVRVIEQGFRRIERDLKDVFSRYDRFKFVQPEMIQSAKEALNQFEDSLNQYRQYISPEMLSWYKGQVSNLRRKLESIEAEIVGGKSPSKKSMGSKGKTKSPSGEGSVNVRKLVEDAFPTVR